MDESSLLQHPSQHQLDEEKKKKQQQQQQFSNASKQKICELVKKFLKV